MNIQEAASVNGCMRRSSWLQGIHIWIQHAGTKYAQMVYAANANANPPWVEWVPSHQDIVADDWETISFDTRPVNPPVSKTTITISATDALHFIEAIKSVEDEARRIFQVQDGGV